MRCLKYLNECVVEQEHDGSKVPDPAIIPEEHLAKVADIPHFRVTETELPYNEACVQNDRGHHDCQD